MSKWRRYVKTLQVYFVKMVQVHNSVEEEQDRIIIYLNASLIIEHSKCTSSKARIG